jgi:hypothetical protein
MRYYIGFLKQHPKDAVLFKSAKAPKREDFKYFVSVSGPYESEREARHTLDVLKKSYGMNPAYSERQRLFTCAELGRLRAGESRKTKMTEEQLRDFCRKSNPFIAERQIRIGTKHELEHTTDRAIARKIACDHLKEDPKYYTHLAKMEKMYKKNVMSSDKALRLTKKVVDFAKDVYKEYKTNPGMDYHYNRFLRYMKELDKYVVGSRPYIEALAKAYEHLESIKASKQ